MKRITLMLTAILLSSLAFSQKIYRDTDWKLEETKKSGSSIIRLEGENTNGKVTNVGYESQKQLIDDLDARKKAGKIGGDKYKQELKEYEEMSIGGMVYLYIERPDAASCNNKHFKISVKSVTGAEVYTKEMRPKEPKANKENPGHKNDGTVFVKAEAQLPLMVEVYEATATGKEVYKFRIVE